MLEHIKKNDVIFIFSDPKDEERAIAFIM